MYFALSQFVFCYVLETLNAAIILNTTVNYTYIILLYFIKMAKLLFGRVSVGITAGFR